MQHQQPLSHSDPPSYQKNLIHLNLAYICYVHQLRATYLGVIKNHP